MAWERQGNRSYYYRSRKVGRCVVRDFLGNGVEAHLAAALVQERQRLQQAGRQARQADRQTWDLAWGPLQKLVAGTDLLVHAALLAAGFHQHCFGDWRKRRGKDR